MDVYLYSAISIVDLYINGKYEVAYDKGRMSQKWIVIELHKYLCCTCDLEMVLYFSLHKMSGWLARLF